MGWAYYESVTIETVFRGLFSDQRERSVRMSLQCTYSRILELIISGNVILSSHSFNEKTTAGFEGGGVMVLTQTYTFL